MSGTHSKTTQLLSDFQHNARDTQMHDADLNVHDVANALKRWFKSLPGSLLTEELHNQWIDTSGKMYLLLFYSVLLVAMVLKRHFSFIMFLCRSACACCLAWQLKSSLSAWKVWCLIPRPVKSDAVLPTLPPLRRFFGAELAGREAAEMATRYTLRRNTRSIIDLSNLCN